MTLTLGANAAPDEPSPQLWQKDLQILTVMVTIGSLQSSSEATIDRVRELEAEADRHRARGQLGEMRRHLSQAMALLSGRSWTEEAEFGASLVLTSNDTVLDPAGLFVATLSQQFETAYRPSGQLVAHAELLEGSLHGRQSGELRSGTVVKEIGSFEVLSDDLMDTPFSLSADLDGIDSGAYRLRVTLHEDGQALAVVETNVQIVSGFNEARRDVESRLAALDVREATRASIVYPFDLARTTNLGVRQTLPYDFAGGIERSRELLHSLENGEDPLWRATGDHERHYYLDLARRYEPYRIYIPADWDGESALPLVVALHGSFGDHNSVFRDAARVHALADRYGWAIAAPMGYAHNSVFGNRARVVLADGSAPPTRPIAIDGIVLAEDEYQPSPAESAVLTVVEQMKAEYDIDPDSVFLTGISMGAEGVWHLGAKYPCVWSAIAPVAAALHPEDFDDTGLLEVPVLAVHGDADPITSWQASERAATSLRERGGDATLLRVRDGGHSIWMESLEEIFDFFSKHTGSSRQGCHEVR